MAPRYRKIDPRIWNDEKFRALSREEKLIALYVLTAQSNRLGFFRFSKALAAEDLNMPVETFAKGFEKVCKALAWRFDEEARVLLVPKWFRYNCPENPNVLKSCLEDLHELPQTPLISEFALCVQYLPQTFHETFRKGLEERFGKPCLDQEQEQEQEQEYTTPACAGVGSEVNQGCTSEPAPATTVDSQDGSVFLRFQCRGPVAWFDVTEELVCEYEQLYPGIDVRSELRKAYAWTLASPHNRKTASGMRRFLVGWLNRAANWSSRGATPVVTSSHSSWEEAKAKAQELLKLRRHEMGQ